MKQLKLFGRRYPQRRRSDRTILLVAYLSTLVAVLCLFLLVFEWLDSGIAGRVVPSVMDLVHLLKSLWTSD